MLNQLVLVGRLVKDIELRETESKKKVTNLTLAIPRSFKNSEGQYETDFIECTLWEQTAINTSEYCKKGSILGIKGRIQTKVIEKGGVKRTVIEVIAEKVTFLSSKPLDK
ncbi:MAG: single-stranded DNA-binding protein [Bacilli bacterium]